MSDYSQKFKWRASINCESGKASATEVSTLLLTDKKTRNLKHIAEGLVSSYPEWLSYRNVTMGILRTAPYRSDPKNQRKALVIRDAIFGLDFLIFGKMQTVPNYISNEGQGNLKNQFKKIQKKVTVELPIIGGILTVQKQTKKDDTIKKSSQIEQNTYGSMRFSFVEEKIKKDKQNVDQKQQYHLYLKSEIVDYPPTIAGSARPVSMFRKTMYLTSQPLVHAFVMWRYHKRCREIFNSLDTK